MPVLYFHGALEGKKYELIEKDNRASFEMDCGHQLILDKAQGNCAMEYESVIGQGHIEMLNEEEKYEALKVLMKQYRREDFPFNEKVIPMTAVFRLRVESMTGKRRTKKSNKLKIHAMNAIDNAYAPYSNFKVGACIELADGQYINRFHVEKCVIRTVKLCRAKCNFCSIFQRLSKRRHQSHGNHYPCRKTHHAMRSLPTGIKRTHPARHTDPYRQ